MRTIAICIVAALLGAIHFVDAAARAQKPPPLLAQQTYTVTLTSNYESVIIMTGGGTYPAGSTVTVTMTPNWTPAGWYTFGGWWENGEKVSSSYQYAFKLTKNRTLKAQIVPY